MESIIQDPNVQKLIRDWEDKGRIEEARSSLYRVLALRSLPVSADVRARIDGEPDIARLVAWHDAAVTAATTGDVFGTADRCGHHGSGCRGRSRRVPRSRTADAAGGGGRAGGRASGEGRECEEWRVVSGVVSS